MSAWKQAFELFEDNAIYFAVAIALSAGFGIVVDLYLIYRMHCKGF